MNNSELIVWKFQSKSWLFWFVIPDDRDYYGGDFYVNKNNFNNAKDWDRVKAKELLKTKWKKPEAKIIEILWANKKISTSPVIEIIEWIYSWWDWNFGFIDVEWMEKWYFVYWDKKANAVDWDRVKAEVIMYKWKKEAIVKEVIWSSMESKTWIYKDNEKFWFVITDDNSGDIFIAWSRKLNAKNWDKVEVKIIKKLGKNPEGIITKIIN